MNDEKHGWELSLGICGNEYVQTLEDISKILKQAAKDVLKYDGWEIRMYYGPHHNNCGRMALWTPSQVAFRCRDKEEEQASSIARRKRRAVKYGYGIMR